MPYLAILYRILYREKMNMSKIGTKSAFLGYFLAKILKKYSHI